MGVLAEESVKMERMRIKEKVKDNTSLKEREDASDGDKVISPGLVDTASNKTITVQA